MATAQHSTQCERKRKRFETIDTTFSYVSHAFDSMKIDWLRATMFARFLCLFLIEPLARLEPDPLDVIQDILC